MSAEIKPAAVRWQGTNIQLQQQNFHSINECTEFLAET